jgi:hypothetical protein
MSEDPRTPPIPEPEGDSSTPGAENNQPAEPTKPAPLGEELEPRRRGTGTLIHRFTGSLRRVTSFLGTGELREEPEEPAKPAQGPQKSQGKVPQEDNTAQPGYMFTGELRADLSLDMESPEAAQPPEHPETGPSSSELDGIDIPLDRMPLMTGQLRSAFTGFLRGTDEESEITDDMLTGRLGRLEAHPAAPEQTDNLSQLTGALKDLRGEMPSDATSFIPQASEDQEENLPEERFGMFLEQRPAAPVIPAKPMDLPEPDLNQIAENMWQEPPRYSQQEAQPVIPLEDIWGTGSEKTDEPAVDQAGSEAAEVETPPEVPFPIRTASLGESELEEAEPPATIPPTEPEEPLSLFDLEPVEPIVTASLYDTETSPADGVVESEETEAEAPQETTLPLEVAEEAFAAPTEEISAKPTDEDISSLRETLASEDTRKRRGSGLFSRITGSLRRVTDSLGNTGTVGSTGSLRTRPSIPPEKMPGDEDEFFTGRLGLDETPSAPAQPPDLQSTFADIYATPSEETAPVEQEPVPAEEEAPSPVVQPAEPETSEHTGWMTELRQETTEDSETYSPSAPTTSLKDTSSQPRGVTGQLRSFITTILRGPEERRKRSSGPDISDDVVTGRLEKTMVTGTLKKERPPAQKPDYLETPQEAADLPPGTPRFDAEAENTTQPGETRQRGITGQLRSFITSILRSPEDREKDTGILELPEVPQTPPKSVTGRLGSSVTAEPMPSETFDIWGAPAETAEPDTAERAEMVDDLYNFTPAGPTYSETAPSEELEEGAPPVDRFSMFFGDQATVEADEALQEGALQEEAHEEEEEPSEVLWGNRQGTVMPGDLPDIFISEEDVAQQAEAVEEEEEEEEYPQTGSLFGDATDDDLIASYLGGYQTAVGGDEEQATPADAEDEALEARLGSADMTAYNLRSIALEGYQDIYEPKAQPIAEAPEVELAEGSAALAEGEISLEAEAEEIQFAEQEKFNLKAWLGVRRNFRMIILAEVVLILIAALVMSPVFLAAIRGTPQQAQGPSLVAKPLPADVPYPTEVTFPGGWEFILQKSTFTQGKWQPKTAEWLEGSEVRRVLALPWNTQTEAVVQTFKPGDTVELTLSNQDMVNYKITSIDRVPVSDNSIYTDKKPSLAIILYQEDAQERWVITCRP